MIDKISFPRTFVSPRGGLMAMLLGGSALVAAPYGFALADDATVLPEINVSTTADSDETSIAAQTVALGGGLRSDILDTAASVSVITAKEVQDRGARSVEQVLQYTPGVVSHYYGSDDRFDYFKIRGFDAYTYRDGVSMGKAFGNVREEPLAFERVEVLRGADSTVFGISDPGGAVNYVTRTPKFENFNEVFGTYGSFNHAEVGFDMGRVLDKNETLAVRLTGKVQDSDAEYDYAQDNEKFIQGGVTWQPSTATKLSFVFDYIDRDSTPGSGGQPVGTDFDRSDYFGEPDFNYRDTNRATYTLLAEHDFGGGLKFSSTTHYDDTRSNFGYVYLYDFDPTADGSADRYVFANTKASNSFATNAQLEYDTTFGAVRSRTLGGVEYSYGKVDSYSWYTAAAPIDIYTRAYSGASLDGVAPYTGSRTQTTVKSTYLREELTYSNWIAAFGTRYDDIRTTSTNLLTDTPSTGKVSDFTYSGSLTYKVTEDLSAYFSYAQSMVPASVGLDPERGEQYELGVKYRPAGTNALLSAAIYDLTKNNITRTDPVTFVDSTIGEVRVKGIDLEARGEVTDNLSLTAAYSYMDSEIVHNGTSGNEGNQMSFVPQNSASLWANYRIEGNGTRGDATVGLGARYTGKYWMDDANTERATDAVVFDASASYEITDDTVVQLNISNLFDDKHVAYGGFGSIFYNQGRAAYVTLRHRF